MTNCGKCNNKINRSKGEVFVECSGCKASFHATTLCTGLAPTGIENIKTGKSIYKCSDCKTPRRPSIAGDTPTLLTLNSKFEEFMTIFKQKMDKVEDAINMMVELKSENLALKGQLDEMKSHCNEKEKQFGDLVKRVNHLENVCDHHSQQELLSTIEIQNIPDDCIDEQSLSHTAISIIGNALDITVSRSEIVSAQLIKAKIVNGEKKSGNMLILKLLEPSSKNAIINARREKNKQNGFRGIFCKNSANDAVRIYINERLTARRRELLKTAREWRKKLNFKFLWITHGRICMRRKDGDRIYNINSFEDFSLLNSQ
uniref:Putative daphne-2 sk n=1 Tax=Nyssomyia neivai TaxID=330878 RepID=A0A1L8DA14_9DIPT